MSRRQGQKGAADQALGRSRGGFSTKVHLKTDFGGLPMAFSLTGGEASDSRRFETLLDIGPEIDPRAALSDKGYNSKSNHDTARHAECSGNRLSIRHRRHSRLLSEGALQGRARIEQGVRSSNNSIELNIFDGP